MSNFPLVEYQTGYYQRFEGYGANRSPPIDTWASKITIDLRHVTSASPSKPPNANPYAEEFTTDVTLLGGTEEYQIHVQYEDFCSDWNLAQKCTTSLP